MNTVTALLERMTALLEHLGLVCNFFLRDEGMEVGWGGGRGRAPCAPLWIRHCFMLIERH